MLPQNCALGEGMWVGSRFAPVDPDCIVPDYISQITSSQPNRTLLERISHRKLLLVGDSLTRYVVHDLCDLWKGHVTHYTTPCPTCHEAGFQQLDHCRVDRINLTISTIFMFGLTGPEEKELPFGPQRGTAPVYTTDRLNIFADLYRGHLGIPDLVMIRSNLWDLDRQLWRQENIKQPRA